MTEEVKSTHLKLRIPQEKKELIRKHAYEKGLSMSSYIRFVLSEDMKSYVVQEEKTNNSGGKKDEK